MRGCCALRTRESACNSLQFLFIKQEMIRTYLILCSLCLSFASLTKIQSDCELESLSIGTRLSDRYNNLDEHTDWDTRIHHDYLAKYLGFAGWIQMGLWKNTKLTAFRKDAPALHQVFITNQLPPPSLFLMFNRVVDGLDLRISRNLLIGH